MLTWHIENTVFLAAARILQVFDILAPADSPPVEARFKSAFFSCVTLPVWFCVRADNLFVAQASGTFHVRCAGSVGCRTHSHDARHARAPVILIAI
jgi:hypothetical protein